MIKTFKHKGLAELFEKEKTSKISKEHHDRCIKILAVLDDAEVPTDMNFPGWKFHSIGGNPLVYSIRVNGNYRITFEFNDGNAYKVWYGDYH